VTDPRYIRNFCIVAHIDHGKSTLADRLLEITGTIDARERRDQVLDDMDLERERGITIKASAVAMTYRTRDRLDPKGGSAEYVLHLIDTPGHVDFSYEVQKALQACEGAVLLVDAAQGVEAQTVANANLAMGARLAILPALNKVDLAQARPEEVIEEIEHTLMLERTDVLRVSAKTGAGASELLEAVIDRVPHPKGDPAGTLRALLFDAKYDEFRGVVVYVRVVDGRLARGARIRMLGIGTIHEVEEVGKFRPRPYATPELAAGEVGYVIANIKRLQDVRIGDTIALADGPPVGTLPGYQEPKPMVFCGLYPTSPGDYEHLRRALEQLRLNDASFTFEPETSEALGFGFRCGFLGLLHMEIIQERLERESNIDLVQTAPTVTYEIEMMDGERRRIHRPSDLPEPHLYRRFLEPVMRVSLLLPADAIGPMMQLCTDRRGRYVKTEYLSPTRVMLVYDLPLGEILYDFYDRLKSVTRGYGTMDYELRDFEEADLVKLRILVAGEEVDALSTIVHRDHAEYRGRRVLQRLRSEIPRHLFEVALQAAIGGKVIARESIRPLAKNVLAKCYGGDVTRKRKLLEKQKEGKRRMKQVGGVEIPQKAFLSVLGGE
jgi:GTP-binding protein LepA